MSSFKDAFDVQWDRRQFDRPAANELGQDASLFEPFAKRDGFIAK
jgi:hypothetical protein